MTWKDDLNFGLAAFGLKIPDHLPGEWGDRLTAAPSRDTAAVVVASSVVFYLAERDHNPKVNDVFDAMVYCSTCLSVGYGDIFARTPVGKLVGTILMTLGPALTSKTLDGNADAAAESAQAEILASLRTLLERFPQTPQNADIAQ